MGNCSSSPPRKSVKRFLAGIRKTIKAALGKSATDLINELNPKIRGWANYHRHVVSKRTFNRVDHSIFYKLWQWARRRHPNKDPRWLKEKYFERHRGRDWFFFGETWDEEGNQLRCGCCSRVAYSLNDTSKSEAKLTRTILHMKPTSSNAEKMTCWTRFGVLVPFASSGMNNADFALCAIQKSLGSRVGAFTIAFPASWVVRAASRTEFYFIRSAITGFTTSVLLYPNRVSFKGGVRRA